MEMPAGRRAVSGPESAVVGPASSDSEAISSVIPPMGEESRFAGHCSGLIERSCLSSSPSSRSMRVVRLLPAPRLRAGPDNHLLRPHKAVLRDCAHITRLPSWRGSGGRDLEQAATARTCIRTSIVLCTAAYLGHLARGVSASYKPNTPSLRRDKTRKGEKKRPKSSGFVFIWAGELSGVPSNQG